ncbi:hypothetical protein E5A73_19710 [Sphingomonas gei]|uniref:DUF1403 family protein n=2 Tax=Sphingomonas gei TaxID=1395960 RepID=A0A4S1X190_9SPHN|nr:hypothetical protein E5A73_19710 [Sphingomonas gei]
MARTENLKATDSLLLLGRLDGRLLGSACADIFLARSRLAGAAALAGLAGVPIGVSDLQRWIAGRSPPPRASEGLNDPISVAAVFHLALARDEDIRDPVNQATLNILRSVLDDRAAATAYGSDDLAHFGPMWRQIRAEADAPFPTADLLSIAERVFHLSALTNPAPQSSVDVVSFDGRSLDLPPRQRDRLWLIAVAVPRMLYSAGFTSRFIPSLVLLPKFLPPSPAALAVIMADAIGKMARTGLKELDAIERAASKTLVDRGATRRSKAPLLARLQLTYPGLQTSAVSKLLNVTPQGARKLLEASAQHSSPVLV